MNDPYMLNTVPFIGKRIAFEIVCIDLLQNISNFPPFEQCGLNRFGEEEGGGVVLENFAN